eukprot:GILI01003105.1.p1 GENE.GILI01003105.1~~GILI01003105.1.p1  ORF type:complete len:304 (+),score=109.17 GILI01003105.1:100-1011(+)
MTEKKFESAMSEGWVCVSVVQVHAPLSEAYLKFLREPVPQEVPLGVVKPDLQASQRLLSSVFSDIEGASKVASISADDSVSKTFLANVFTNCTRPPPPLAAREELCPSKRFLQSLCEPVAASASSSSAARRTSKQSSPVVNPANLSASLISSLADLSLASASSQPVSSSSRSSSFSSSSSASVPRRQFSSDFLNAVDPSRASKKSSSAAAPVAPASSASSAASSSSSFMSLLTPSYKPAAASSNSTPSAPSASEDNDPAAGSFSARLLEEVRKGVEEGDEDVDATILSVNRLLSSRRKANASK